MSCDLENVRSKKGPPQLTELAAGTGQVLVACPGAALPQDCLCELQFEVG